MWYIWLYNIWITFSIFTIFKKISYLLLYISLDVLNIFMRLKNIQTMNNRKNRQVKLIYFVLIIYHSIKQEAFFVLNIQNLYLQPFIINFLASQIFKHTVFGSFFFVRKLLFVFWIKRCLDYALTINHLRIQYNFNLAN